MRAWKTLGWLSAGLLMASTLRAAGPAAAPVTPASSQPAITMPAPGPVDQPVELYPSIPADGHVGDGCMQRGLFESDRAFDGFIGPITNPVLTKDPRSLTEARLLFVQNRLPGETPLTGGDFQVYAMQLRLALTDRLTFIADKDGYAVINPSRAPRRDGWLNVAAGLKYTFIRDVENQFLVTGGFMYEPQTGESSVFQGHGDGLFTFFGTVGKEFGACNHALFNFGYQVPVDSAQNSSFFFTQLHLDRQMFGWFYPLVEVNWYHWVAGGDRGLPPALGEGDGLLNLGTSGVAGNDLVTVALGFKIKLSPCTEFGAAWEVPVSNRRDLIDHRLTADFILRY